MSYKRLDGELMESTLFSRETSSRIKNGVFTLNVSCPKAKADWKGFVIRYNHKVEEDREAYFVEPARTVEGSRFVSMTLELDLAQFPFRYTHWSVDCAYEEAGQLLLSRIQRPAKKKPSVADFLLKKDNFTTDEGNIAFAYTQKGNYLGLRYRKRANYDSQVTRFKEVAARVNYRVYRNSLRDRGIYLVYEKRCQHAQDNGYYFFRYCMENDMESYLDREIYYVLEKGSPDEAKLAAWRKNVVPFMSVRHMTYLLAANLLISPDSRAHAYAWQYQQSIIANHIKKVPHVFLGHGVLALKRLNDSFTAKNLGSVLCTVVSDREKHVFTDELGYRPTQAVITGYSRFDALVDSSDEHNEILVMPTHRNWLFGVEREVFCASEYYKRYMDLINSPRLIEQLEAHDLTLKFYLHPSIGEHVDAFTSTSDRVQIVPYGVYALDDLMMRCKMLVTDYSSVSWDVLYMGKPVVFYQYDTEAYLGTWGSYIDLEKDTPGVRVTDADALIDAIVECIEGGFVLDEEVAAKRDDFFAYTDQDNTKRICEVLKERRF